MFAGIKRFSINLSLDDISSISKDSIIGSIFLEYMRGTISHILQLETWVPSK